MKHAWKQSELGGLLISEENEPSHLLLEKACQINEANSLKYIEPAACTSRSQEVQGSSKTKELGFEGGALIVKDKDDKLVAPASSEMQFMYAMASRGIAFKFAKLMSYQQHSQWTSFLLQAMQCDAPQGYSKPSLHQVMMCDKAAFTRMASSMGSVRQRPDNTCPLGERLLELRSDSMIVLHLAPLARAQASQVPAQRSSPYAAQTPKANQTFAGDRKGKGMGKEGKSPPMPLELRNKWHRTSSGCVLDSIQARDVIKLEAEKNAAKVGTCAPNPSLQAHSLLQHPKHS